MFSVPGSYIKGRKKRGAALAMALYILVILITLGTAILSAAVTELKNSEAVRNGSAAFYIADAGLDECVNNVLPSVVQAGMVNNSPASGNGILTYTDPVDQRQKIMGTYTFYIEKLPQKPKQPDVYKVFSWGFLDNSQKPVSYGQSTSARGIKTLMALVRKKTSADYVIFADQGQQYRTDSNMGNCYFGSGDTIKGKVYLGSNLPVQGNPSFGDRVEVTGDMTGYGTPIFKNGFYPDSDKIDFPNPDINKFKNIAYNDNMQTVQGGMGAVEVTPYYYDVTETDGIPRSYRNAGTTGYDVSGNKIPQAYLLDVNLMGDKIQITALNSGIPSATIPYPANGILFLDCDAAVHGTVNGRLTIFSQKSILIPSDIVYTTKDSMLGIIAFNSIYFSQNQNANILNVDAALMSVTQSVVGGQTLPYTNYWNNAVNFYSLGPVNATLKLRGAIISKFGVATYSGSSGFTTTNLSYDSRLSTQLPPEFPQIIVGNQYEIVYWRDMSALGNQ